MSLEEGINLIIISRTTLVAYLLFCYVGLFLRCIGGTFNSFWILILGRVFEGWVCFRNFNRAGYEVTLGLLEVFICGWCSARLSFSLATRHCLGHIGYILASLLLPYLYNRTNSVRFCFWVSLGVLTFSFVFAWILIGVDLTAPDTEETKRATENGAEIFSSLCLLPFKVWMLLIIGSVILGITQGFTIIISGYSQRQFGYTNQEGAFLIVFLLVYLS